MMDDSLQNSKSDNLCRVCGDKASGKHYGVASCDGCRGFFKRSIRRNLEYICKENNNCIVDVTRRNQCQACRFKKCLQVNMKRDAVQHERAPRSTQTNIHHYPYGFGGRFRALSGTVFPGLYQPILETSPQTHYFQQSYLYSGILGNFSKSSVLPTTIKAPEPSRILLKDDEVTSSEETERHMEKSFETNIEQKSSQLHNLESIPKTSIKPLEVPCLNLFPAENIYETATKLLFLSIKWAKSIPSFLQLSFRDQSVLLEENWSELFVLTAAQWAFPIDENLLVSNAIASTSRHNILEEDARKLRNIIIRLSLLRLDHTEYACLKALVLFKAETRGLSQPAHVELLQDQTHIMLHEYCSHRQSSYKGRFGKLLLTLPAIQSVSSKSLEELIFKQTVGDVVIDRLLADLSKSSH